MLAVMGALLVAALYVPGAFTTQALGFAIAYGLVRVGHIALFVIASRDDSALRRSVIGFGVTAGVAICLLVGASFVDGNCGRSLGSSRSSSTGVSPRSSAARAGVSYRCTSPSGTTSSSSLRSENRSSRSTRARRYRSTVSSSPPRCSASRSRPRCGGSTSTSSRSSPSSGSCEPSRGRERNALARDSYSYLHFPMVAGIVLAAFGLEETLAHVDKPLDVVPASALLGGTALYLLAHVALRLRTARTLNVERLAVALLLFALDRAGHAGRRTRCDRGCQRDRLGDDRVRDGARVRRRPLRAPPRS